MSIPATRLHGVWKLTAFSVYTSAGTLISSPYGPTPVGRLVLGADGYMSCALTDPALSIPLPTPWAAGSDAAVASVARGMTTYCGAYTVYEEEGETWFRTEVEMCLDPSWVGTGQVRRVELVGAGGREVLTLRPESELELPVCLMGPPGRPPAGGQWNW